jgi:hypothetical protein
MRDGAHDFDFNIGVWHTHIKRILDPLSGATKSIGKTWEINRINKYTRIADTSNGQ